MGIDNEVESWLLCSSIPLSTILIPCQLYLGMKVLACHIDPNVIETQITANTYTLLVSKNVEILILDSRMGQKKMILVITGLYIQGIHTHSKSSELITVVRCIQCIATSLHCMNGCELVYTSSFVISKSTTKTYVYECKSPNPLCNKLFQELRFSDCCVIVAPGWTYRR